MDRYIETDHPSARGENHSLHESRVLVFQFVEASKALFYRLHAEALSPTAARLLLARQSVRDLERAQTGLEMALEEINVCVTAVEDRLQPLASRNAFLYRDHLRQVRRVHHRLRKLLQQGIVVYAQEYARKVQQPEFGSPKRSAPRLFRQIAQAFAGLALSRGMMLIGTEAIDHQPVPVAAAIDDVTSDNTLSEATRAIQLGFPRLSRETERALALADALTNDADTLPPHPVPEEPASQVIDAIGEFVARTSVNVRTSPTIAWQNRIGGLSTGTNWPVLEQITGQLVTMTGISTDVWYRIRFQDTDQAYVWGGAVDFQATESPSQVETMIASEPLTGLETSRPLTDESTEASTSEVAAVPLGTARFVEASQLSLYPRTLRYTHRLSGQEVQLAIAPEHMLQIMTSSGTPLPFGVYDADHRASTLA